MPFTNSSRDIFDPLPICDSCLIKDISDNQLEVLAQDEVVRLLGMDEQGQNSLKLLENDDSWSYQNKSAIRLCFRDHKNGACIVNLS